jgi:hypothetical protein
MNEIFLFPGDFNTVCAIQYALNMGDHLKGVSRAKSES